METRKQKKNPSDAVIAAFAAALALIAAAAFALSVWWACAYIPYRAAVDLTERHQTLRGFGASSAWYWQDMGANASEETAERAVEMLYGDDGLRLNIFRYNIGGGSADAALDGAVPYSNGGFDEFRRAESFFVAENVPEAERGDAEAVSAAFRDESNYDFENRDAAVRSMFGKALATGNVTKVVFFANSPHYLMTESGTCTGEYPGQNNLKPEFYEAFADYLLIIVNNLYETYLAGLDKVPTVAVSPVNEPQWDWGGPYSSQEGCHYDPEALAALADVMQRKIAEFNAENGTRFELDLFESGSIGFYDEGYDIRDYLSALAKCDWFCGLDGISVHDYVVDASRTERTQLRRYLDENYPHLAVRATEFCEMQAGEFDTAESGMYLAKVVLRDLTLLDAEEWSWWLSVAKGTYNDGLVYWNAASARADGAGLYVLKRYYAFAQFTRYLSEGDVRVGCTLSDPMDWMGVDIGAFVKPDGSVVVVAVNDGAAKSLRLDGLEGFEGRTATAVCTDAEREAEESDFVFGGRVELAADSVTTFAFSAV